MDEKNHIYSKENILKCLDSGYEFNKEINKKTSYTFSYNYYIDFFKKLQAEDDLEKWLVLGSSIVYAWMPTILNIGGRNERDKVFNKSHLDNAVTCLKNINKQKDCLEYKVEINPLIKFINNSVVGTSKFLHFSYPDKFPIWDSRVESVLYETAHPKWDPTKSNYHRIKIIGNYMEYRKSCLELIKDNKNGLIKKFDKYEELKGLRDLRKIEFLLFLKGGKK